MSKIYGWLSPDGEYIPCGMYEHLEAIATNPIFLKRVPEIEDIFAALEEVAAGCQELADREGSHNAEWHIYEMECDRLRPKIWKKILNAGFIRVGEVGEDLHFEGRPNVLRSKYQMCKDFADSYGAGAVFEPQR
jgi:hypothetical protein